MVNPPTVFALLPRRAPLCVRLLAAILLSFAADARLCASEIFSASSRITRQRPPRISVTATPAKILAGGTTQFTIHTSKINTVSETTITYTMTGTAVAGQDYSAPSGAVTIPAGGSSAAVTIDALGSTRPTKRVATLRLQRGAGYKVSSPSRSSVTILPSAPPSPTPTSTATPTPSATPSPSATPTSQQEIWIAIRTDGLPGSGTQSDPFDGSTSEKFDTLLYSYRATTNLTIHLSGAGPFRTKVGHAWRIRPGWIIAGDGMYATTVLLVGDVTGLQGAGVFASDPNIATDNVTIQDLTVDCNWPELSSTAPIGINGEKDFGVSAVLLCGSNNLLERMRCINTYGSHQNHREHFALFLTGPRNGDGTNNIIRECVAEMPHGSYGNPFALAGWIFSAPYYLITNSKVVGCTAIGVNNGKDSGFTSGGVNMANVKDCEIDGNTFIDCFGAAYSDTGSVDGLRVTNNTVIRGWQGVGLANSDSPKQNVVITGNNFNVQNRRVSGASYGVVTGSGVTINLTVSQNTISFDSSGTGVSDFCAIAASLLNTATISDNTIGFVSGYLYNYGTGSNVTMFNNRMIDGSLIPGLGN